MPAKLKLLEITTTIGCPNNCKFCPQDTLVRNYLRRSKITSLSLANFKKCLKSVPKDVRIDFSGMAEPWLNKDCTKMILYAHNQGYKLAVYTTTIGMSPDDIDKIEKIPFVDFSVHLADSKGNTKIIVTESYLQTLLLLKNSKIINVRYMALGPLHPKLTAQFGKLLEETYFVSRAGNLDFMPLINIKGPITCSRPEWPERSVLLPNGEVVICGCDYGLDQIIGNLLKDKYQNIFKSKNFKKILDLQKNDLLGDIICRHCEFSVCVTNKNFLEKLFCYIRDRHNG